MKRVKRIENQDGKRVYAPIKSTLENDEKKPTQIQIEVQAAFEKIKQRWQHIINQIKIKRGSLGAFLESGVPMSVADGRLEICFEQGSGFQIHAVNNQRSFIQQIIQAETGYRVHLVCLKKDDYNRHAHIQRLSSQNSAITINSAVKKIDDDLQYNRPTATPVMQLKRLPYQEYLQTEHWQQKRKFALNRANNRCMICYSNGLLNVHHRTYERIGEEMPSDVIALCEKCHGIFHDKLPKPAQPGEYFSPQPRNGAIKSSFLNEDRLSVLAKYLKRAHDEFVKAGFTEEQAFSIVSNYKWS